jgi:hypothetical protein
MDSVVRATEPDPQWIDRLVELHMLAEHGDLVAAATADRWIATDVDARRMWDDVERIRDQLRATPTAAGPEGEKA